MASPLILRITSKFDPSGVNQAQSNFRGLQSSIISTNRSVQDSFDAFHQMNAELAGTTVATDKVKESFGSTFKGIVSELRTVRGVLRLFRTALFVEAFVVAPLTAFIKKTVEVEQALTPIITRLNQLGQAGQFEGERLKAFAENLQRTQGVAAKDTLQALDVLITKTRSAANAEDIINTAQRIHLGTGQKLAEVTKAIADAQSGNSASLAVLTGRTEQEISALARSGELVTTLNRDFAEAAQRGANTFSGRISIISQQLGQLASDATKASLALQIKFTPFSATGILGLNQQLVKSQKNIQEIQSLLDKTIFGGRTAVNLQSFEALQATTGKVADQVRQIQGALSEGNNLTSDERKNLEDILTVRQKELGALDEQLRKESQLAQVQRDILTFQTQSLDLQNRFLIEQNRPAGRNETSEQEVARRRILLDQDLQAKLAEIDSKAVEEHQAILKHRDETDEEFANIESKRASQRNQARIATFQQEQNLENQRLDRIKSLRDAELKLREFQLQTRFTNQFQNIDSEEALRQEERLDRKRVELAVLDAKKERDGILAERQLTAEDAERIEKELQLKVSEIQQTAAKRRADFEDQQSKLTADQRKQQEEAAQKQVDRLRNLRPQGVLGSVSDFTIDTDALLKKSRGDLETSTQSKKLKEDLKNILTPEQIQVKGLVDALENSLREKKLKLNLELLEDRSQLQSVAQDLSHLIADEIVSAIRKKLSPLNVIQQIISGAAQGGSES